MKSRNSENEAGNVNWERLEQLTGKKQKKKVLPSESDEEIKHEARNLSNAEKQMPYPDEFLADVNLLNKSIGNYRPLDASEEDTEKPNPDIEPE